MKLIRLFSFLGALLIFTGCIGVKNESEKELYSTFEKIVSDAREKVFPSVVYIHVVSDSLESGARQSDVVFGSGVLITPDGELLTNAHVIDKAQTVRCQLNDGRAFYAKIIGSDKDVDLALVKLELPENTPPLPYAEIDRSGRLNEGDFVMAMGAPWGLNRSVSIGIISCSSRYLENQSDYSLWYQTDAAISPGNSGGPLVTTSGKIAGINTLGSMMGGALGFAIPSNTILDVVGRLREYGKVNWAWLGLRFQPLNDFVKNISFDFKDGVIVSGTDPGSPARKAGFLPNDRIIAIDGKSVTVANAEELPDFNRMLGMRPFEKNIAFTVSRGSEIIEIVCAPIAKKKNDDDEISCPRWGLTAKTINRFTTPNLYFYKNEGVYIFGVSDDGNAENAGLFANDIIVSVNDTKIETLEELESLYETAVKNIDSNSKAVFAVLRNGRTRHIVMDFLNKNDDDDDNQ